MLGRTSRRRWLIAIPLVVVGLVALVPVARTIGGRSSAAASSEAYRYRFPRAERGSVRRALEQEIAFYQERLARDPAGGLDLAALGRAYLKMARATGDLSWYLLAEQVARRSLASLPFSNAGAVLVLARVAEARHDFDEAIRLARQAGGAEETLSILVSADLARGRVDQAAGAADLLVQRAPGLVAFTLRALAHIAQGKDDEALRDFEQALASEEPGEAGSSAWARTMLGRFHARRGRLALARGLYHEVLTILPQYPLALVNLAELEARTGQYEGAARHFAEVVDVSSASPNVYDHVVLRGLGRLKALQGEREAAEALWARAEARLRLDAAQGAFGHRRELARLLLDRGRPEDLPEALSLMQAEVQVRRDPETLDTLAWAYSRAGRRVEARQAMQEALRWGTRDAAMFTRAATIAQMLGDQSGARQLLAAAKQTDPAFDEQARRAAGMGL
jgi:tetratricopeptide (TPR) repeat protein